MQSSVAGLLSSGWRVIARHKAQICLVFVAVLGATATITALMPKTYLSETKLLVRLGRENTTVDATATLGQAPIVAVPTSRENELNSFLEIFTSRNLIEKVVDSVGPEAILRGGSPEPNETSDNTSFADPEPSTEMDDRYRAVVALRKAIKVEAVKKSNIVVITCEALSPATARAVVSRLINLAVDRHTVLHRTPGAYKFLGEQAARLNKQVIQTEMDLLALKDKTGVAAPESQRQVLVARVGRLEDDFLTASTAQTAAEAEVVALKTQLAELPKTQVTATTRGVPNQGADLMRGQFFALQLKEQELRARHADEYPEVKLIRRQLNAAQDLLNREPITREQVTSGPNKVYEEQFQALVRRQAEVATLKARLAALAKQLSAERAALKTLIGSEVRIARLQRRLDLEVSHHRKYAENLEQAQIDQALQQERISNISVVQPATYEIKPIRPRWSINLGFGLVLALAVSLGLVFLTEQRQSLPAEAGRPN